MNRIGATVPASPVRRDRPRFSIVTVVFNGADCIEATGQSVKEQTCTDYEWLVVDGASTDRTLALAKGVGVPNSVFHSEPDRGVYDGMNKAAALARGDWVCFLNAGDRLVDRDVLRDVSGFIDRHPALSLIHGDVRHDDADGCYIESTDYVRGGMLLFEELNHQSVFARRSLFESVGLFNLDYAISADFDWLIRVFRSGCRTSHVPRLIADYLDGGMSCRDPEGLAEERRRLRQQYASPFVLAVGAFVARIRRRLRIWSRVYQDPLEGRLSASSSRC